MSKKKRKHINWNEARNMDVDAWRDRQIHKKLAEYLAQRERDFIRKHGEDTAEELLEYVSSIARELHRMPHPMELDGGEYLQRRLGDWQYLAQKLGLKPPSEHSGQVARQRLKQEVEEAFLRERRAMREEKKLAKVAKDKETNHIQATWERNEHHNSEPQAEP